MLHFYARRVSRTRAAALALLAPLAPFADLDAQKPERDSAEQVAAAAKFESSLQYKTGTITLEDGLATLNLSPRFRYLDPAQAETVLVKGWGNPPGTKTLGMILPADVGPLSDRSWGVIITYDEDGYVKDDDAETIDYTKLMKEMQESTREANAEREKQGYEKAELVGWAQPPHYDKATHKLYWAKELAFDGAPERTLNYNVRVLGRGGVLVLNAVAGMSQLASVETDMKDVIGQVDFNTGNRYADFKPGVDKVAAYGIAALVAGKVAMKVGFFKLALGFLIAMKKFLVIGVIAVGSFLRNIFRRRAQQATTPTPS
jgi:uncharacterized membrane-anchored protein